MAANTYVTLNIFNAVKILLNGGASRKEAAEYMNISKGTVDRIAVSETFEDYRQMVNAYHYKKKAEAEKKAKKEKVEKSTPKEEKPAEEAPAQSDEAPEKDEAPADDISESDLKILLSKKLKAGKKAKVKELFEGYGVDSLSGLIEKHPDKIAEAYHKAEGI